MDISKVWAGFGAFMKVWGPWITTALIPTLIVGFSKSAKTQGAVAWLKYLLQLLSFASPKDAPNTFKLPFTVVTLHPSKLPPKDTKGDNPPTAAVIILIGIWGLTYSLAVNGCAWISSIGKGSEGGIINCAVQSIMSNAANLIATVRAILTGGAVNWQEQLDALKNLGEDALACALYVVGAQLQQESVPPATAVGDTPAKVNARSTAADGYAKAQEYLTSRKLKPTGPTTITSAGGK